MEKKRLFISAILLFFLIGAYGFDNIDVMVNDVRFNGKVEDDIVYLPLEELCDRFEITFGYFNDTGIIAINYQNRQMSMVVNQKEIIIESTFEELDHAPRIINNSVYLSASFFMKYLGLKVTYRPEDFDKGTLLSDILYKETEQGVDIFIKGDKTLSRNEFVVQRDKKLVYLTFPDARLRINDQSAISPSVYVEEISWSENEDGTANIAIRITGEYDIEVGPVVSPPGMVLRIRSDEIVDMDLPENTVTADVTNETVVENESEDISIDTDELPVSDTGEVISQQDTGEFSDGINGSYLENIDDLILEQGIYAADTVENHLEGRKIVIDAGHGGSDNGITKFSIYEKDITLKIAKLVYDGVAKKNAECYMTRTSNKNLPEENRVFVANRNKADLFISIHMGASVAEDKTGFSIFYYSEPSMPEKADLLDGEKLKDKDTQRVLMELKKLSAYEESRKFSRILSRFMTDDLNYVERYIYGDRFAVLRDLNSPGVILEVNQMTNRGVADMITDDVIQEKIAEVIVEAIDNYLSAGRH
ncbi:MAG: N-acetylmuramoyl-L-alanine amidase [Candidatus Muiribacteriaceae bacterium]